jgi:hypothetical protein
MVSERPSKAILLAGLIPLAGALSWLAITHRPHNTLSYDGQTLAYWFNELPMTSIGPGAGPNGVAECARKTARHIKSGVSRHYGIWSEDPEISKKAIQTIGTKGLEFYLCKLKSQDSVIQRTIQRAAFGIGLRTFLFPDADAERGQAVTALVLLKPLPEETRGELLRLSTNRNAQIAIAAHCVLIAQPSQLSLMLDPDELIRRGLENKPSRP